MRNFAAEIEANFKRIPASGTHAELLATIGNHSRLINEAINQHRGQKMNCEKCGSELKLDKYYTTVSVAGDQPAHPDITISVQFKCSAIGCSAVHTAFLTGPLVLGRVIEG